jgi:hypothetical protein
MLTLLHVLSEESWRMKGGVRKEGRNDTSCHHCLETRVTSNPDKRICYYICSKYRPPTRSQNDKCLAPVLEGATSA